MSTEPRSLPPGGGVPAAIETARAALADPGRDPRRSWQALSAVEEALLSIRLADGNEAGAARELVGLRESIRERIVSAAAGEALRPEIQAIVRGALAELETRVEHLLEDTGRERRGVAEELRALVDRALFLDTLLDSLDEAVGVEPLEDVFAGLVSLRHELDLEDDPALGVKAGEVLGRALAVRAGRLEGRVAWLAAVEASPEDLWAAARAVEECQTEVATRLEEAAGGEEVDRPTLGRLRVLTGDVRSRLAAWFDGASPGEARARASAFAVELRDRADEVLTQSEDLSLEAAVVQLDAVRSEIGRLRELTRARVEWPRWRPFGGRREGAELADLVRAESRLVREGQEKKLQRRLEAAFGRRFVTWLENGTFVLILLVVGLLAWEQWGDPSDRTRHVLMWVDTGICAVFLADFLTRMALVERRGLYFLRHALIDFLPSIPFGLLAHNSAFDVARSGRLLRFLRLPRLLRYIRVARPAIRVFRVVAFLIRGVDRMVRRHAGLLNRSVVAFDPPAPRTGTVLSDRVALLLGRCRSQERKLLAVLEPDVRRRILLRELGDLEHRVGLLAERPSAPRPAAPARGAAPAREIRLERVLDVLVHLDGAQVEAVLGHEQVGRLFRYLRLFQAPIIRNLPFTAPIARIVAEASDPYEATAEVGRLLGRVGQRVTGVVHWFSDLSGTVTAPQFLGMLGSAVVRATSRPAFRLLLFGGIFVLLDATVELFEVSWLEGFADLLDQIVGLPLVVLGAGCLLFLVLGNWFRRIAGEASDFYERIAEAHFLALMEDVKLSNMPADLALVYERVLYPEEHVRGRRTSRPEGTPEAVRRLYRKQREIAAPPEWEPPRTPLPGADRLDGALWLLEDRVVALLRDYLDGAILHRNDTKTTSQLLGNLSIQRIVNDRLELARRDRKRLDRLDLERERGFLGGPYLWFKFITGSVAQRTARLLIEYNRHAVPLAELECCDEATRAQYRRWLEGGIGARRAPSATEKLGAYATTEFTALNFLSADPERDRAIEERFGAAVLARLRQDRRMLVRNLFGTYPLHRLPKERRTFNPYDYYHRRLAGGRILVYPLRLAWGLAGLALGGAKSLVRVVRDLLDPERVLEEGSAEAGFEVAERKIYRMRRPVYLEAMRLRARFDVEYLKLRFPGELQLAIEGHTCWEDLDRIEAVDRERDFFRELQADRQAALRRLGRWLEGKGFIGEGLARALEAYRPGLSEHRGEALRGLAIAFAIDYQGLRSFLSGLDEAEEVWQAVVERPSIFGAIPLRRRVSWAAAELWRRRFFLRRDPRRLAFRRVLARSRFRDSLRRERSLLWQAVRANLGGIGDRVRRLGECESAEEAVGRAEAILRRVLSRPDEWTEELVTLRTIQTLAVLDIRNYRNIVWELGRYAQDGSAADSAPRS